LPSWKRLPVTDHSTRLEITSTGPNTEALTVGGHPLVCSAATLDLAYGNLPVLTVTLPVVDGLVVTLDSAFLLAGETHAALVAMGWTPPAAGEQDPGPIEMGRRL
jgi:hypothetical protein